MGMFATGLKLETETAHRIQRISRVRRSEKSRQLLAWLTAQSVLQKISLLNNGRSPDACNPLKARPRINGPAATPAVRLSVRHAGVGDRNSQYH